jgi:hypothetical protein
VLIAFSVVFTLVGCERLGDVKRCRQLAAQVNPSLDTIEEVTQNGVADGGTPVADGGTHAGDGGTRAGDGGTRAGDGGTRVGFDKAAYEYDAIAKSLEAFDAGSPELVKAVSEYAGVARSSARQSAALADALGANNPASASLASRELERLARHEKAIVARIDELCQPR